MAMVDPGTNRPYAPPSNVTAILKRLRSRNLPDRIDIDYLRDAGIPEGSIHRTVFALRFLGLVADEQPTGALREMARSTDEEYQGILATLVRQAYQDVFAVIDPAEDSQDRILNVFRRFTPASQRSRMVNFFLGICREAGIPTLDVPRQYSSQATPGGRMVRSALKSQRRETPARAAGTGASQGQAPTPPPSGMEGPLLFGVTQEDIAKLTEEEFNAVWLALGKVARARTRQPAMPLSTPDSNAGEDEETE
jgi:hypothetical protein